MSFKSITESEHAAFVSALAAGQYNVLLGAGFSMDSHNDRGKMPSGDQLKAELCTITGAAPKHTLQRVFSLLKPNQIKSNVTDRFAGCTPGQTAQDFSKFLWRRIFTWNIDDVLQNQYAKSDVKQRLNTIHYSDEFVESPTLLDLNCVHLHGTVKSPDKGYVFSREQYISAVRNINPWMSVLTTFMHSEPMIIAGTSLDEVDLDYYLSFRTEVSARRDRGPSILVTSEDDAVTADLCERHQLLHFAGYSGDFFRYCVNVLPSPPTPEELVPTEERKLLPVGVSRQVSLAFYSDFELVPSHASPTENSRFPFGHAASWGDLAANLDVPRPIVSALIATIEKAIKDESTPASLLLLLDSAGTGKTTILRRIGYELARRGYKALLCSTLSRIDKTAAEAVDMIDEPVVILVDNLADQATAVAELLSRVERKDLVILGSERSYRSGYLESVLSGLEYTVFDDIPFSENEVLELINKYALTGNIGDGKALKNPRATSRLLRQDPIAVACCRIQNDYKPLERIVEDLIGDATNDELERYIVTAIAQHCFMGGIRRSVLVDATNAKGLDDQLAGHNPLSLSYYDSKNSFVIPENSTLGERIITRASSEDKTRIFRAFVNIASSIRPYVNRQSIIQRSPEARLAGRLFDFDDVVRKFLGDAAENFYAEAKDLWRWNSRYWEQVALLNLSKYWHNPDSDEGAFRLEEAVRHARHAVAIEEHPFPLTTLGKALMVQMLQDHQNLQSYYDEAYDMLTLAIDKETTRARRSIHPFVSLFSGTEKFLSAGGKLGDKQRAELRVLAGTAEMRFSREVEFIEQIAAVRRMARF